MDNFLLIVALGSLVVGILGYVAVYFENIDDFIEDELIEKLDYVRECRLQNSKGLEFLRELQERIKG